MSDATTMQLVVAYCLVSIYADRARRQRVGRRGRMRYGAVRSQGLWKEEGKFGQCACAGISNFGLTIRIAAENQTVRHYFTK
jgi:hypothetical protein